MKLIVVYSDNNIYTLRLYIKNYTFLTWKAVRWETILKAIVKDNTSNIRSKAAPHPCRCAKGYGWDASLHILSGSASTGELKLWKNKLVPKTVIIKGAVSPAILDIAKTIPVVIPLLEPFTTTCQTTLHFGIPSA